MTSNEFDSTVRMQESRSVHLIQVYVMFLFTWQGLFRVSDSGMNVLFRFLGVMIGLVSSLLCIRQLSEFVELLPLTITAARKMIGNTRDCFTKYASCPKCHFIYPLETCKIVHHNKSISSLQCTYVAFPNHRHASQRMSCNTILMKKVRSSMGTCYLHPRQLFCYQSLIDALRNLVKTSDFFEQSEL